MYIPLRNSYLMEALHALIENTTVEKVQNQTSLTFLGSTIIDLSSLNKYLKSEKFKLETPESIRTS